MSVFLRNLLHFGDVLRAAGLDVPAGRMIDVVTALGHVDIGRRSDFYFTLRALLVQHPQDLAAFDEAFHVFWRRPPREWSPDDLRALGERRRFAPPERQLPGVAPGASAHDQSEALEVVERVSPTSYSGRDVSRTKDFARFTDGELEHAKAMIRALKWNPGERRTRRWRPARGERLDVRRLVRRNLRFGAELVLLPTRRRRVKRRPLVLLCDVSGSMERYSRLLLHFVHSLFAGAGRVEAFLFATRLTRITREVARLGADDAMRRVVRGVPDWGGGTRIGEALRTFNVHWARRVRGRGPIVLLISDGWDRGEPELVVREMGRVRRSCHRLIWLNPLLGAPEYQPLTRGMQAALPFIDDFLPVHNLASLEALAGHMNALPPRRPARRAPRTRGAEGRPEAAYPSGRTPGISDRSRR